MAEKRPKRVRRHKAVTRMRMAGQLVDSRELLNNLYRRVRSRLILKRILYGNSVLISIRTVDAWTKDGGRGTRTRTT